MDLRQENQPSDDLGQPNQPKRGKKLKKQIKPRGNQTNPCAQQLSPLSTSSSNRHPRNFLSRLIDNNVVSLLEKVYYRSRLGNPVKKGKITHDGIQCDCCSKVFALTQFEAHAGSTNHRPAANILLDDGSGRSLSDCQRQVRYSIKQHKVDNYEIHNVKAKKFKMENLEKNGHDSLIKNSRVEKTPNSLEIVKGSLNQYKDDVICSICYYEGELICCDQCPSTFHVTCLGLKAIPDGNWFCLSCCCGICGDGNSSNDNSFLTCQQCEHRFHVNCLKMKPSSKLETNHNKENWFCGDKCEKVFSGLQMLLGKPVQLSNNLTWTLLKFTRCFDDEIASTQGIEAATKMNHNKLSIALDVLHERFEPSKDFYSGTDVVEDVIFNRESKYRRMNFKGFYTIILEQNDDIASVATIRVYGDKVVELPLVATRFRHQRRGMCRALMTELEKNMINFGVEKLVLPAVPNMLNTWINNFGFSKITKNERSQLLPYTFLNFPGTIMCHKLLNSTNRI